MRTEWYGDKRDLVKWGTLVHLCKRHHCKIIVQVAFLQESKRPDALTVDNETVTFPAEVWRHFRDLRQVKQLERTTGLSIEVLDSPFAHGNRQQHCDEVCTKLARMGGPKVVLLDPDTGMEPANANGKHVTVAEIEAIWKGLKRDDWLVLYQHALRQKDWRKRQRDRFSAACANAGVQTIHSKQIAHDVAFLAALKT